MAETITPRAKNYSEWYQDVIKQAQLAHSAEGVKGCMVIKPNGYALWEKMQRGLDKLFKDTGHVNAYFPLFIPMSYLAKEEQMAEGFAKECAVVTHYRLKAEKGPAPPRRSDREAGRAAHRPAHVRDDHLADLQGLDPELPRPAAAHQPVVQRRPLGDAHPPVPPHGRIPVAGRAHRPRLGKRSPRRDDADGPRVPAVRRGVYGDAGAGRPEDGGPAVPRRGRDAVHRGHDAGRQGAAGRHQPLPRAELRQGVSTCRSRTTRGSASSPGPRAGA